MLTENVLAFALVSTRSPQLSVICMEDATTLPSERSWVVSYSTEAQLLFWILAISPPGWLASVCSRSASNQSNQKESFLGSAHCLWLISQSYCQKPALTNQSGNTCLYCKWWLYHIQYGRQLPHNVHTMSCEKPQKQCLESLISAVCGLFSECQIQKECSIDFRRRSVR